MSLIDPEKHAHLITHQRKVFAAFAELDAYQCDEGREDLREKVRQTVTEKETALYESGLPDEHGYYAAAQALKDAARETAETDEA